MRARPGATRSGCSRHACSRPAGCCAREEALREGEERLRLVIEGVRDYGIFALDPEGRVASWNTGAERIKGWRAKEILGQHFSTFYPGEDGYDRSMRNLADAEREGRTEDEGWRMRKDGTLFWTNVVITALRDDQGELRGFSKVTRDMTERHPAQEALELARQEAEQASTAKSLFLSRISHELRTPLNAILGFAHLLEFDPSARSETDAQSIEQILRAGRHLLALIDEVLDIARIEASKLGLAVVPVPLGPIIAEPVGLSLPEAESRAITITNLVETDSPVAADRRRLLQELLNLLSNAVKYNREGGEVHVSASRYEGRARVAVSDTGIGITPEQAGSLFQPFTRLAAGGGRKRADRLRQILEQPIERRVPRLSKGGEHQAGKREARQPLRKAKREADERHALVDTEGGAPACRAAKHRCPAPRRWRRSPASLARPLPLHREGLGRWRLHPSPCHPGHQHYRRDRQQDRRTIRPRRAAPVLGGRALLRLDQP